MSDTDKGKQDLGWSGNVIKSGPPRNPDIPPIKLPPDYQPPPDPPPSPNPSQPPEKK